MQSAGRECEARGAARTTTELSLDFQPGELARCGLERQERGVVSAVVVVQHHPVIQRAGDRAVQLLCYFQAQDKVVTSSYDVLAE